MRAPEGYDPFVRGRFAAGVRTIEARDAARDRVFPCEVWYPAVAQQARDASASQTEARDAAAEPGTYPLLVFSHHSGGNRRTATFLCTHLAGHGYVVAAMDHSELVAPELAPRPDEAEAQKAARAQAWIANRVPDVHVLLDRLFGGDWDSQARIDPARIGIVGHSFGGWTALAATEADARIGAVAALAPAGSSNPRPGVLPATLDFNWGRDVPALYLVAENDVSLPLSGMVELFDRTPATKQMLILRRADHLHFVDDVEQAHEAVRAMPLGGKLAWLKEMRPIGELCSGEDAHHFARGLTLAHFDAALKRHDDARRFLEGDLEAELAERGVSAMQHLR